MKGMMCIVLEFLLWRSFLEETQLTTAVLPPRSVLFICAEPSVIILDLNVFKLIEKLAFQVNLVDWLKMMVTNRNPEGVLDPKLPEKPTSRALKKTLLVALRCVDPNAQKRPKMGQVVHMLEADQDSSFRDVCILFWITFSPSNALP